MRTAARLKGLRRVELPERQRKAAARGRKVDRVSVIQPSRNHLPDVGHCSFLQRVRRIPQLRRLSVSPEGKDTKCGNTGKTAAERHLFLPGTVALTAEDSGTKDRPVTYAAWPGEEAVISGGRDCPFIGSHFAMASRWQRFGRVCIRISYLRRGY